MGLFLNNALSKPEFYRTENKSNWTTYDFVGMLREPVQKSLSVVRNELDVYAAS